MSSSEAEIHFELYRHLKNSIEEEPEYHGLEFGDVSPEKNVNGGFADIVVEDRRGKSFLVIEAKRQAEGGYERNLDPYSPEVIRQASRYAYDLGSEYFATYNGSQLVLFRTHERGVPLLERQARAYSVTNPQKFASELLEQVAGIEKKEVGWEPKSRTFIKRLKSFHERLAQEFETELEERLDDSEFERDFENWINKQGWDVEEKVEKTRFVNQAAYLLMNKLFFYKVLEDTGHDVPDLPLKELDDPEERREAFDKIVEEVDFEPIYEHDPIFDEIPLSERGSLEVGEFLEELDRYDFDEFKHDTIGHIYEDIIPPEVRHNLGQYYTPPEIVELINKLTIKNSNDKVLDPGCGSGTFLITAYNILKELKKGAGETVSHTRILDQLFGIDINRFPAHLTAINLALQDLGAKTEEVNVEVQDFFNVWPKQGRLSVERVDSKLISDESVSWDERLNVPPEVDVVVANPPYIRQEIIPDKELCRKHLERLGYENFSERADIYAYFFTHATEFLRENGRVGFITSDKWLTVGYGEDLQEFFLDNYKIKAIISFSKRVFETPLVPTCVTILEKTDNESKRDSNIVKFLRVKTGMELDEIIKKVELDYDPDIIQDKEDYRLITKKQEDLRETEKWNRYLYAPPIYWKLINHEKICKLSDIAEVSRGVTTGANKYFHLDEEDVSSFEIEEHFLAKAIKSIRQAEVTRFKPEDTDLYLLDVHDFITEIFQEGKNLDNEIKKEIRKAEEAYKKSEEEESPRDLTQEEIYATGMLKEKNYLGIYRYILWGIKQGIYDRRTCSQRKVWFDLGDLPKSKIISPKFIWEKAPYLWLEEPMTHQHALGYVKPKNRKDAKALAGYLNSDISRLFHEFRGRAEGGRALQILVYERRDLPCLDFRELNDDEKDRIEKAFEELMENEEKGSEKKIQDSKINLNETILEALRMEEYTEEITTYAKALSKARREGKEVSEMISGIEEESEELEGGEIVSEGKGQQKLDEF